MTPPSFHRLVDEYLIARRGLGFDLETAEGLLRNFASHADRVGHDGPVTIELAVQWARSSRSSNPAQATRRLGVVRQFARYRALFDPATEVPPVGLLGRTPRRSMPHIYTEAEMAALLQQASCLLPRNGLRPATYVAYFALLASTGLRLSEARRLTTDDTDLVNGILTIRETKFRKSRLVPLHPTTTQALRRYAASPRRVSCCTSVRVLLPHRAFARAHAHRRADDVPPDQAASRLDRARAHAPTAHPRPASLFRDPDYSESIAQGGWCSGWMRHRTRNNHRLFKKARTSSSGRYRFGAKLRGSGLGHRLFLQLEVGMQIDVGRLDGLVTEPQRDHGAVDAGSAADPWRRCDGARAG